MKPKDYLGYENARNHEHAQLYMDMVRQALGTNWVVLVGHHILYELNGDVETEGEIPSADSLMFDHAIMTTLFGSRAFAIMQDLAVTPCETRDKVLAAYYAEVRV